MEVNEPAAQYLHGDSCRQTDIGELPLSWSVAPLAALAVKIGSGKTPTGGNIRYRSHGRPFVRSQNVAWGSLLLDDLVYIDEPTHAEFSATEILVGDLLLNITGASIGRSAVADARIAGGNVNQHVCIIRTKGYCSRLANYFLLSSAGQRQIDSFQAGGNREGLNFLQVGSIKLPCPPSEREQQAIAEALSNADALIESLSLLLAKKRQIKQGAMQELLTGRKRLPGFTGDWLRKSLSELFQFSGGLSASRDQLSERGHLYLHYGDIHASAKTFIDVAVEGSVIPRLDVGLAKVSPTSLLADGDVVFVDASEDDEGVSKHVVVSNPSGLPFIAGLHTIVAKQRQKLLDPSYLRYCFQTRAVKDQFKFYAVGTKVSGISKRNIAKISLPVPPYAEQEAIGEVLVSMDEEMVALEEKLSKARQFKQGMMQALLTGRIRLVKPVPSVIPLPTKPAANLPACQPAHNWQINEAVVIGVLAQRFGSEQFPLPRKRRVKLTYLLHRHAEGRAEGYLKKAAGPYDPNTKYKGPEQIALKNGYVRALRNEKYEGFVAGDKIEQAQRYFEQWYGAATLEWLERFHYRKTDDLELLATVDMAMVDLAANGEAADVTGVKRVIAAHPEWLPKLSRELFSDGRICAAIAECQSLFGS